jgi:glutamine cyclotransferase
MQKRHLAGILIAITILALIAIAYVLLNNKTDTSNAPLHYAYEVIRAYPHNKTAFTEGLVFDGGFLYEGTGLYGNSILQKVELETGEVLQLHSLPPEFFGEGITVFGDKIIQLTWQNNIGFVYDRNSFELLREFSYPTEGWGITHDGSRLIMSDGTATLYFLDLETFEVTGQVEVRDGNETVTNLNELEYVKGDIYANVWTEDRIAIIDIQTGRVKGWLDLTGLQDPKDADPNNVLNGIAYDASGDRLFVTGKRWLQIFQIKLIPE